MLTQPITREYIPGHVPWRLRAQSGELHECHLIEHPEGCELRVVRVEESVITSANRFPDLNAALKSAMSLAGALMADGWTDPKDDPGCPATLP